MENNKNKSIHRIGTITCGVALIVFGTLFLVHLIVPVLSYQFIFRLWPCILILLGIEILIGNYISGRRTDEALQGAPVSFVYDKGAVILLILMLTFAMVMAIVDKWAGYVITWENLYHSHL